MKLFKAVRSGGANLGVLSQKRGLDVADDPDGYQPTPPGTPVSIAGGAYFTTNESYAIRLATNRRYRAGIVVAVLPARGIRPPVNPLRRSAIGCTPG